MFYQPTETYSVTNAIPEVGLGQADATSPIYDEVQWRALPEHLSWGSERLVIPSRWSSFAPRVAECDAQTGADCHLVKIVLREMDIRLTVDDLTVHDGVVRPGAFHVTPPGAAVRCLFRGPYEVIHLHVRNALIAGCAQEMSGRPPTTFCPPAAFARDMEVERLGSALLGSVRLPGAFGRLYVDSICTAIVARLLATAPLAPTDRRSRLAELPRWRLKRAIDYLENHLAEPIRLADVARAAGVTSSYFAAQFRATTGLRPHEYLLRRRVERGREMLASSDIPVIDVALSVGFENQSHFTTVFKRFTRQPPQTWRRERRQRLAPTHPSAARKISAA
jgi:AraC-like DNA-binding protein